MTDNKVEAQIGDFKSPEELAQELEKNNKKLADRVREIAQKAIEADSKDLRKRLQEELTPEEQLEIRETLPNSGVAKVLNKGLTSDERKAQQAHQEIAGVVGEEAAGKLAKAEGYFQSLSDAWETAGKLFEEGKYIAAFGVILKGIFGQFSLKAWEKKDDEKKEILNEKDDKLTNFSIKVFIEYSYKGNDKDKIGNIAQKENFKKLSFQEIEEIKKNDGKLNDWIKATYGNSPEEFQLVKKTFELFSNNGKGKETLKRVLGKNYNEQLSLTEALSLSNKDLYIFEHINGLSPDELMKSSSEMIRFDKESFKSGESLKKFEERGITLELGSFILTNKEIKVGDSIEKMIVNSGLTEKDKIKFRELLDFGSKIQNEIINNPQLNLGMGSEIKKNLDPSTGKPLNIIEIVKLYTVLGGETHFETMNEFKQSFLYFSIGSILDNGRSNVNQGTYIVKLADLIKDGIIGESSKIHIPEGVLNFMGAVGNGLVDHLEKAIEDLGFTIAGGLKELIKKYPGLIAIIVGIILIYPFTERRTILSVVLPKFGYKRK